MLRSLSAALMLCIGLGLTAAAQTPRQPSISQDDLRAWLTYIASDELQGRLVYTEGLGLAGAYIADHLKEWGVKPGGDRGSYFQEVRVLGVRTRSNSSVIVTVRDGNVESDVRRDLADSFAAARCPV